MKSITDRLSLNIIDLLAILIPGFTGLYIVAGIFSFADLITPSVFEKKDWFESLAYFILSYFSGYVFYVISSSLDNWYDKLKRFILGMDKEGKNHKLSALPVDYKIHNIIFRLLFPHLVDTHNLICRVVEYKNRDIGKDMDGDKHQIINAYQYSYRRLMLEAPEMFTEVEKYYAVARLFRSMSVVLFLGGLLPVFIKQDIISFLWLLGIAVLSFLIYLNRWRKANHVAYKDIIILEGLRKNESLTK